MPRCNNGFELQRHFEELADKNGVFICYMSASYGGVAFANDALVRVGYISGPTSYFVAMHELGHCVDESSRAAYNCNDVIGCEANAWLWAIKNAIVWPTEAQKNKIWNSFMTYINSEGSTGRHGDALELARLLGKTLPTVERRDGASYNKRERTLARKAAIRKVKVGDTLKVSQTVTPKYLRGHEVKVIDVRRTRITVELMTAPIGRRFKVGSQIAAPATYFDQI